MLLELTNFNGPGTTAQFNGRAVLEAFPWSYTTSPERKNSIL